MAMGRSLTALLPLSLLALSALVLLTLLDAAAGESTVRRESVEAKGGRNKRLFFPVFEVYTFPNDVCDGGSGRNGTCFTAEECSANGGSSSGTCAGGFGVCCVFTLGCGETTSQNNSYIVQSSTTSNPADDDGPCTYTICPCASNVCRIRLDFNTFSIAGPAVGTTTATVAATTLNGGAVGDCVSDSFSITSAGNTGSPLICGFNTGQHMIVDATDACHIANFDIGGGSDTRQWDIKITQYECGATLGGPDGCLQYFTGTSGTVSSFNFPTSATAITSSTTHLSNQCYKMCFRRESGFCAICFAPAVEPAAATIADQVSFGLSAPSNAIAESSTDAVCTTDYLQIPNAETVLAGATLPVGTLVVGSQRICGRILNAITDQAFAAGTSVCSQTTPFEITFKSDDDEVNAAGSADASTAEQALAPGGIVGFSLNFQQISC